MKNLLIPILAVLAAVFPARAQFWAFGGTEQEFPMRLYARFLQPGLGDAPATAGDEAYVSGLKWTGMTTGQALVTVWGLDVGVRFETSSDRLVVKSMTTELDADDARPMQAWRQRHDYGYTAGQGYYWDSILDGHLPLDPAAGRRLDAMLRSAFRYWATERLQAALAGKSLPPAPADMGRLRAAMPLRYDRNGLIGTAAGDFFIRVWGVPVHVRLRIRPHTPSQDDPFIIALDGEPAADFDLAELRRRHAYSDEPEFDALLTRCARHWAEASSYVILSGLNDDLQKAMQGLRTQAETGPAPALTELQALAAAARPWP